MDKYNMGVDVNHLWISDGTGGLDLVEYEDNIAQAVFNRLSCWYDSLSWIYNDYGSHIKEYIGKVNSSQNRQAICKEAEGQIRKDPRLTDANVEIVYHTGSSLGLKVTGYVNGTHEDFEEYFLFGSEDLYVNKITHHDDSYYDTYIKTRRKGYAGRPGDTISVHCHVLTKRDDKLVPIGRVSVVAGSMSMDATEIQQSWGLEPGTATLKIRVPKYFAYGVYDLVFSYNGAPGYNSCKRVVNFIVLPKLPTHTYHQHTKGTSVTDSDKIMYMDTYELEDPNYPRYWEDPEGYKEATTTEDDEGRTEPISHGHVAVRDWNGFPVGWDYEAGEPAGIVEMYIEKSLSDRVPTRILMSESDDSFSYEQPYLIEHCVVLDVYDRPVMSGEISLDFQMYVYNGSNVVKASLDPSNMKFTLHDELVHGKNYRLEDWEGNLVDTLKAHIDDDLVYFYSVHEDATYRITVT